MNYIVQDTIQELRAEMQQVLTNTIDQLSLTHDPNYGGLTAGDSYNYARDWQQKSAGWYYPYFHDYSFPCHEKYSGGGPEFPGDHPVIVNPRTFSPVSQPYPCGVRTGMYTDSVPGGVRATTGHMQHGHNYNTVNHDNNAHMKYRSDYVGYGSASSGSPSPPSEASPRYSGFADSPSANRLQGCSAQDSEDDEFFPKPPYSYSCLIALAMMKSRTGNMPVTEIYSFIREHYPYFKTAPDGWKNSVRHNLSLNKCFLKIEPSQADPNRKGCLWALHPDKVDKMMSEVRKWKKKDPEAIRRSMAYPVDFHYDGCTPSSSGSPSPVPSPAEVCRGPARSPPESCRGPAQEPAASHPAADRQPYVGSTVGSRTDDSCLRHNGYTTQPYNHTQSAPSPTAPSPADSSGTQPSPEGKTASPGGTPEQTPDSWIVVQGDPLMYSAAYSVHEPAYSFNQGHFYNSGAPLTLY
ncbi:uncharacterized protein LOC144913621 [Branchiostoma floridae x Branchiostoma belcheri]